MPVWVALAPEQFPIINHSLTFNTPQSPPFKSRFENGACEAVLVVRGDVGFLSWLLETDRALDLGVRSLRHLVLIWPALPLH